MPVDLAPNDPARDVPAGTDANDADAPRTDVAPTDRVRTDRARIEIVGGPTCCGKSVYIAGLPPGTYDEVLFVDRSDLSAVRPGRRYLLHYNLLRPFDAPRFRPTHIKSYVRRGRHLVRRAAVRAGRNPFAAERWLDELLGQPFDFRATVLVAPRTELLARVRGRSALEPLLPEVGQLTYEQERWAKVYAGVDLPAVFRAWFDFLRARGVPYSIVNSGTPQYAAVPDEARALELIGT